MKRILFPLIAVILLFAAGVAFGGTAIQWSDWFHDPVVALRAVRMAAALIIGGALALSGMTFQAILRNPLAEPFTLGISGGASVGAVLAMITGLRALWFYSVPAAAFAGAAIILIFVLWVSRGGTRGGDSLLLSGVIAGTIASSVLIYLLSIARSDDLATATWWMLGDLQSADEKLLIPAAVFTLASGAYLQFQSRQLDAFSLGDEEAFFLGSGAKKEKIALVAVAALLAAETVSIAGIIGFCGLIVPHIVRRCFGGASHTKLTIPVFLWGAAFLMFCDILSRTLKPGEEIPIGVLTAVIGGAVFLKLLNFRPKQKAASRGYAPVDHFNTVLQSRMELKASHLHFSYGAGETIRDLSLTLRPGTLTVLAGANGCGKSTLLKLFGCLLTPGAGEILLDNRPLGSYSNRERALQIAVMSQTPPPALDFTVYERVLLGRFASLVHLAPPSKVDLSAVDEALAMLDLRDFAYRRCSELSGGEYQRCLLAAALARQSQILLLDEPTSALDPARIRQVLEMLKNLPNRPAILMVTHDLHTGAAFADEIVLMKEGSIVSAGTPAEVMTNDNLARIYGCGLSVL